MMQARPIFLGGIISAVLLRLGFEPYDRDFVAWFALVPLVLSLYRHRTNAWLRLVHGLAFGLVFVPWTQTWYFTSKLAAADPIPTALQAAVVSLKSGVACTLLAFFSGLFALASGPLLRGSRLTILFGLPFLWTSLEIVRSLWPLSELDWLTGWLTLGYVVDAEAPVARIAPFVGIHGLSAALVFSSVCFASALLDRRWKVQVVVATLGAMLPLALHLVPMAPVDTKDERQTRLAIVVTVDASANQLQELVAGLVNMEPTIVLFPDPELLPAITSTLSGSPSQEPGELRHDDRLIGVYSTGGAQPETTDSTLARTVAGALSVNGGHDWLVPSRSRAACHTGAELLTFVHDNETREGQVQISNIQRFRARESQRGVVAISTSTALIAHSSGATILELPAGLASAAVEQITFGDRLTFYTRYGGVLEIGCLVITLILLLWLRRSQRRDA